MPRSLHLPLWVSVFLTGQWGNAPSMLQSDVGMKLEVGVQRAVQSAQATRDVLSPLPYHTAWDCRAERGASPQHREHPRSWVGGSSNDGSSGIGPLHSSGHTRTRDSSGTSLLALSGRRKSHMRGLAQAEGPRVPRAWGRVLH